MEIDNVKQQFKLDLRDMYMISEFNLAQKIPR